MVTFFACLVTFFVAWKLARKYQDFADIMLARRIAKMIEQRDTVNKDRADFDKWERQDKRLKTNKIIEDDEI